MEEKKLFEVTTTKAVADEIKKMFHSSQLEHIESVEDDPYAGFSNKPLGLEPITTIIIAAATGKITEITVEFIKDYLLKKLKKEPKENVIKVVEKKEEKE